MIFDAVQTLMVGAIVVAVWRETASSRAYRDKHLRLQGDRLDVDLLTELRLRRLLGRDVVAVADALQDPERQEQGDDFSHALDGRLPTGRRA